MAKTSRIQVKGMVCKRCIYVLSNELSKLGLEHADIRLGEVILYNDDPDIDTHKIKDILQKLGFDLLYNKHQKIIDDIKRAVDKGIRQQLETGVAVKFSVFISKELNKEYGGLSTLFSFFHEYTLEKFIILSKIEKVKELLVYTDQTLSDIAYTLGYSSPAHLSNQLKKYTGFTSSHFKEVRSNKLAIIQKSIMDNTRF
ncbi:AraC family transcriptional regulator [Polluticaenibacter yanchengensis]|uniref:AraC family transcriptional regulator n=1 Tax=Polluticaenibacter yanchengensis TaxID=3014562 RepID=A0ABT4UP75_9BACT|nr:AraC family transcriptional regulator [Chitinophagaceae bacterium LY-5]